MTKTAQDKLFLVKEVVCGKKSPTVVAKFHQISPRTLYRWIEIYQKSSAKNKNNIFLAKYVKGLAHPKTKKSTIYSAIRRLVISKPNLSCRQIAGELNKKGIEVSYVFVNKYLGKIGAATVDDRLIYKNLFSGPGRLDSTIKYSLVKRIVSGSDSISAICREFNLPRRTIARWVETYKKAPEVNQSTAHLFKEAYVTGETHPKAIYPKVESQLLEIVAKNPAFSVHKLKSLVPASSWTIWKILDRNNLNKLSQRLAFAQTRLAAEEVKIPAAFEHKVKSVFETFTPNMAPAPPPSNFFKTLQAFGASFATTLTLTLGLTYWYRLLFVYSSSPVESIGLMIAALALISGSIFFLYSLKYYLTLAIVLSYSQDGTEKTITRRGGLLAKILGINIEEEKIKKAREAAGLEPDLSHVHLNNKPFISVQIPFYNEKNVVERAIRASTSFKYGGEYEVVLCDDSTDETSEIIRRYQKDCLFKSEKLTEVKGEGWTMTVVEVKPGVTLKHIHRTSRNGYKGQALDLALKLTDSRTEFVAVFDADFVPYPDSLELFLKYFKAGNKMNEDLSGSELAAVQGYQWHVLNKSENWITRGVRGEYSGSYVIERSGAEIYGGLKQISGSVYMIRRDVLAEIGWGSSITEDFELTLRLYAAGYKVLYTPYIQAPAECVSTVKRLVRQRMRWAEGHSYNIKRMFKPIMLNKKVTLAEKVEFLYLSPYYLQAFVFLLGTVAWLVSETVFRVQLPFWSELWGWSLVLTNLFALPLVNAVGLFVEESEEKDYLGIFSFVALSYLLVPFQAYASVKGLIEKEEGPWFRTPKTGRITDIFSRGKFYRFIQGFLPSASKSGAVNNVAFGNVSPYLSLVTANNRFENSKEYTPHVPRLKFVPKITMAFVLIISMLTTNLAPFFGNSAIVEEVSKKLTASRELKLETKASANGNSQPEFELTLDDSITAKVDNDKSFLAMPFKIESVQATEDVHVKLTDFNNEEVKTEISLEKKAENKYLVSIPNQKFFAPGKYTLETTINRNGKKYIAYEDFSWGVLAVNATKSTYKPGEIIDLSFGVLDDRGKTLCDASLILTVDILTENRQIVLQTKDGSIRKATDCAVNNVGMEPDYFASITAGQVDSEYKLSLEALTRNGIKRIEDSVFVKAEANDFEIERTSFPTRIYPPVTYPVKLTIKANKDYKGEVTDSMPENFEVTQVSNGGKVGHNTFSLPFTQEGKQTVTWSVDWKAGETYSLEYRIKFPPVSPQFYLIGPLSIGGFSEDRSWQVASDVNAQIRHEINILTHTMTGSAVEDSKEWGSLSQGLFNGTVTAYFEAVISGAASNTGTVTLRAGSTEYASLTGRTDGTLTRTRSSSFSPAPSGTYYYVRNSADGVRSQTIKSAKIIVIQNAQNITSALTDIDIGNYETGKTNTTASALGSPKYWKYTAANWDGTLSLSAQAAVLKTDDVGSTPTFVSAGSVVSDVNGGGSVTPTMPTHAANDILIVAAHNSGGDTPTTSTTGWQSFATVAGESDSRWFWKRATGAGTAGPTVTTSNTDLFAIGYVISGAITTGTPFEAMKTAGTNTLLDASTTPTTTALTTLGANRLVMSFLSHDDDTGFSSGNPPSGWTADSNVGSTDGTDAGFHVISKTQASIGTVSQATFGTLAAAEIWGSTTIAFIPNTDTTPGVTVKLQEDDGSFGSWSDKATILNNISTSGSRISQSVSFTPTDGRSYRIVSSISNGTGHSYDFYGAKIIIYQTATPVAGVSYDTSSSNLTTSGTSLSWSHTNSASATFLTVGVTTDQIVSGVTYGGQNMTKITETGLFPVTSLWKLESPPTGSNTVQVTVGATGEILGGAISIIGATGYRNTSSASDDVGDQTVSSITLNTSVNELVVDVIGISSADDTLNATGAQQTTRWGYVSTGLAFGGATSVPVSTSTTPAWGWTNGASYSQLATSFFNGSITKLEPQYLILNTASTTTGSALNYQTLWDSSEWGGVTNTYYYAQDARGAAANSKLIDRDNSNAVITNSSITGANQQISSAITMPTTGHQLDTQIDNAGTAVDATRILVKVSVDVVPENPLLLLLLSPLLAYAMINFKKKQFSVKIYDQ